MLMIMWRHCDAGSGRKGNGLPPECVAVIPQPIKTLTHELLLEVMGVLDENFDDITAHHPSFQDKMEAAGVASNRDSIDYEDVVEFLENGIPIDDEDVREFVEGFEEDMGEIVKTFIVSNFGFIKQHMDLNKEAQGEGEDVMSWTRFPHY